MHTGRSVLRDGSRSFDDLIFILTALKKIPDEIIVQYGWEYIDYTDLLWKTW